MTIVQPEQLNARPLQPPEQFCRPFSLAEILSATNNFDESLVIGHGGFGKVYNGVINNGTNNVAIKRLNSTSKQGDSEFRAEIELLSKFRHTHIASLIGYCNNSSEMILVYDYMVNGSLADHLYKVGKMGNSSTLSWVQRLKICLGAARGLDYLHTGTTVQGSVIHRDVKSSNILLDKNWASKVSDFGLSRIGPNNQIDTHISTNVKGTAGYMDPEYYLTYRLTMKSDVYSFGIVLFEVLCGRRAVDFKLDEEQWSLARWVSQCIKEGTLHRIIDPKLKWEILPNSLTEFVRIADQCLCYRSKKRPTMTQVVASLELALALQLGNGNSSSFEMGINLQPVDSETEIAKPEEKKEEPKVIIVVLKLHMHCEACAQKVKKRIQKMRGVENADPDQKNSQVTVKGVFDPQKLVEYVYKRAGKHAVIVNQEPEKKEENGEAQKKTEEKDAKKKSEEEESESKENKKEGGEVAAAAKSEDQADTTVLDTKKNEFYIYYPQNYEPVDSETEIAKPEEKKEEPKMIIVVLKLHMHCEACAQEVKKCIQKMRGVENADPDQKNSQVTVKGVFDPQKLVEYVYKRSGKHAVIVNQEPEKKKENGEAQKKTEEKDAKKKKKKSEEEESESKENKKEGGEAAAAAAKTEDQAETTVLDMKKNEFFIYYPQNYEHVDSETEIAKPEEKKEEV